MSKQINRLVEIKDALLSNTQFIKSEEKPEVQEEVVPVSENTIKIDKTLYRKLKLLAHYYDKEPGELVNDSISHFLRLKSLDIEEALKNIVVGGDEE